MRRDSATKSSTYRPSTASKTTGAARPTFPRRGDNHQSRWAPLRRRLATLPGWAQLPAAIILLSLVPLLALGLLAGGGYLVYRTFAVPTMDPTAYQDSLISVSGGDLPAPPFIGWEQEILEAPPTRLEQADGLSNVSHQECAPGSPRHQELDWLIMNDAHRWSGTEMYNSAYNSKIRIDMSNAHIESNGLDYGLVDRWLQDCGFVAFDQDDRTVRITYTPLAVDMGVWGFDHGRAWVQTVSTTTPQGYQGATSTITTMGETTGASVRAALTFRGRLDENSIQTMDLLWSAQAAKLDQQLQQGRN